ncbi:MAG: hypothetical protein JXQ71_10150 [Verrucomicrobia bacterium]|nr:hypothetical protein [Verrucomicrobiota bacterium]
MNPPLRKRLPVWNNTRRHATPGRAPLPWWLWLPMAALGAHAAESALIHMADSRLQVAVDATRGALRELILRSDGFNQVDPGPSAFGLWQLTVGDGMTNHHVSVEDAGAPGVERLAGDGDGLRLVWSPVVAGASEPLRVEVLARLDSQNAALSRWELAVVKPKALRLEAVRFPRIHNLRPRAGEVLAVPHQLGMLTATPRALAQGTQGRGVRLAWRSPHGTDLSLPCLAFYQPDGPGFYAACDDPEGYWKELAVWGDGTNQLAFEIVHAPEQAAVGLAEFRLPFAVMLGAFRGDWTSAAQIYRASPAAKAIAERGRLRRRLVPAWLLETGLWVWNRGRSSQVLHPAVALRKHLKAPVSVLWHWWHHCAYDAGFPEYLPPREGAQPLETALASARRQEVHAILYMNQRLWCTNTASWTRTGAEPFAVRGTNGTVVTETYNTYLNTPCAPMCIATAFWQDQYAALAREVLCGLHASGLYMDQAGVLAACYDPRHGHIPGPGRYWADGFARLTSEIRDGTSPRGPVALGCEYPGEPWIGDFDLHLALSVSADRIGSDPAWEPIPFFQAVYHPCTIVFGNLAGLTHPPYDEQWPGELAPATRLSLLDRKFAPQFHLEQARTFVWGMQPMLANFLTQQLRERPEEMDFVTRLVRTRLRSLKYLLHGTWLRPPALDVPKAEIDVATLGVYTPLKASRRSCPVALAGAWRAPDGDVGIALAGIGDTPLRLALAVDPQAYGLPECCTVCRIDERGRRRLGRLNRQQPVITLELPPRGLCVVELSGK